MKLQKIITQICCFSGLYGALQGISARYLTIKFSTATCRLLAHLNCKQTKGQRRASYNNAFQLIQNNREWEIVITWGKIEMLLEKYGSRSVKLTGYIMNLIKAKCFGLLVGHQGHLTRASLVYQTLECKTVRGNLSVEVLTPRFRKSLSLVCRT